MYNKGKYRFAYNGIERVNEKASDNNYYTALHGEYDPRVVRRDNVYPVFVPGLSPYVVFGGNPIRYNDVLGDKKGDPVLKDDAKGSKGSTAPNEGLRGGDGSITGGEAFCKGCGARGEDTWGVPDENPLGGSGSLNVMQAANMDIGRNDYNRSKVDNFNKVILGELIAAPAIPAAVYGGIQTAPIWVPSLVNSFRVSRTFAAAGAGADIAAQLATKGDIREVNPVSSIANGFIPNPIVSAIPGSFIDLSYNTLVNKNTRPIIQNPSNKEVWISIMSNAAGNVMGSKLGSGFSSIPVLPGMSKWGDAAGNFLGNIGGASIEEGAKKK